jgi:hypothetical protein
MLLHFGQRTGDVGLLFSSASPFSKIRAVNFSPQFLQMNLTVIILPSAFKTVCEYMPQILRNRDEVALPQI